ncbi:diaminopimelate epimerase [Nisaea sp.]|uniref:diaminopimelate epimerase n=1 Tax=Nisaea sp. TaxID=2024842 RepID=UPI003B51CDEF
MRQIAFLKMNGLGNDFVVLDGRLPGPALDERDYRAVGDRRRGVGYDQFLTIEAPKNDGDAFMRIHNPDGSEAGACGNGTRCVADLVMAELGKDRIGLETIAGTLICERLEDGRVRVDMGPARLEAAEIPLAESVDTLNVEIPGNPYGPACCVNMGNPHAVIFVEDADAIPLSEIGPKLETSPLFPDRANIEFATVRGAADIRMRVWERGAGITEACGSGACAVLVAAARRGLTGRKADVELDGGTLTIEWREDGHVLMTGPVALSFSGTLDLDALS